MLLPISEYDKASLTSPFLCLDKKLTAAWKKQLKGKTDYEIARRYFRTVLRLRDAIKFVRNPFISNAEMEKALKEHGFESAELSEHQKTNRAVYSKRWEKVKSAWSDLDVELLEAEVSWGRKVVDTQAEFIKKVRELFGILDRFLAGNTKSFKESGLIYDTGAQDKFSKEVEAEVEKIRNHLKPHLQ